MPTCITSESSNTAALRPNRWLHHACVAAGIYGIGFGTVSIPTGLFVGPQMLLAALGHIVMGLGFLSAASGLNRGTDWAVWITLLLASLTAVVGAVAFIESAFAVDSAALVFWGAFTTLFAVLVFSSARHVKWRFSLRTLLIATTLVAVVLGVIV